MAAVAAPKICREREKKEEKGGKKEKRGARKREKGKERERRERCIRPMGVKHPLTINCQKIIKDTKRGGGG